jgi:t-SNARE complex subunit (syntaxin)
MVTKEDSDIKAPSLIFQITHSIHNMYLCLLLLLIIIIIIVVTMNSVFPLTAVKARSL